jgi:hypothetical protein
MTNRAWKKLINKSRYIRQPYLCEVVDLLPPDDPVMLNWKGPGYPFKNGDVVLMLGEILQMPGHVAVALKDGRVVFGYHVENFRPLTDEEA